MNQKNKELSQLKPKIVRILKIYGIKKAGIFGSYARGEQKKKSDIDILIQPSKHMGFAFFGLAMELQKILKKRVDLATYDGLNPRLRETILKDEVKII